jgi:hypothetical protein
MDRWERREMRRNSVSSPGSDINFMAWLVMISAFIGHLLM